MPCLLKAKTAKSPGIISFTSNEYPNGVIARSKRIRKFLEESTAKGEWLFGVHIQGDFSYLKEWPMTPWQSFVMWPIPESPFIQSVPKERLILRSCIHFLPNQPVPDPSLPRPFDLCIITQASTLKKIYETLQIVRGLMDKKPDLKVVFIVPDQRDLSIGERTYEKSGIDRRYFELPLKMFGSKELENLSFLSSSSHSFGKFPIATEIVNDILRKSKFMLLTSTLEGGPRVVGEAFLAGAASILLKSLKCGVHEYLNESNTLLIDDEVPTAVDQIFHALNDKKRWSIDDKAVRTAFSDTANIPVLKEKLSQLIKNRNLPIEGDWFLEHLSVRLPGHGKKFSGQILYQEEIFFRWLELVQKADPYNDDLTIGAVGIKDEDRWKHYTDFVKKMIGRSKGLLKKILKP